MTIIRVSVLRTCFDNNSTSPLRTRNDVLARLCCFIWTTLPIPSPPKFQNVRSDSQEKAKLLFALCDGCVNARLPVCRYRFLPEKM